MTKEKFVCKYKIKEEYVEPILSGEKKYELREFTNEAKQTKLFWNMGQNNTVEMKLFGVDNKEPIISLTVKNVFFLKKDDKKNQIEILQNVFGKVDFYEDFNNLFNDDFHDMKKDYIVIEIKNPIDLRNITESMEFDDFKIDEQFDGLKKTQENLKHQINFLVTKNQQLNTELIEAYIELQKKNGIIDKLKKENNENNCR